jgi:hypothetical protein
LEGCRISFFFKIFHNARFPNHIRYFFFFCGILNDVFAGNTWIYSLDGIHVTDAACRIITESIFAPLISQLMKRPIDKHIVLPRRESLIFDYDVRMFAPQATKLDVYQFSSWGGERTLQNITRQGTDWRFQHTNHHNDVGHICYGTNQENATAVFELYLPREKCSLPEAECSVAVTSIRSWNTSYIGTKECTVYQLLPNNSKVQADQSVLIAGNKMTDPWGHIQDVKITLPASTQIASHLGTGHYTVECMNIGVGTHSCISGLNIQSSVWL